MMAKDIPLYRVDTVKATAHKMQRKLIMLSIALENEHGRVDVRRIKPHIDGLADDCEQILLRLRPLTRREVRHEIAIKPKGPSLTGRGGKVWSER